MQKGFQTVNLHGCASGTIATPIIGENENWWIGNDDTGIPARGVEGPKGEAGAKGDKGDQGPIGPVGEKGDKGERGEQGIQGPKGETGEKGATGAVGAKGDKGDTGAQGSQGIQGPQGPQGIKGEQGATGEVDPAELERIDGEIADINQSLGGLKFKEDSTGKYVAGADSVWVRLGSIGTLFKNFSVKNTSTKSIGWDTTQSATVVTKFNTPVKCNYVIISVIAGGATGTATSVSFSSSGETDLIYNKVLYISSGIAEVAEEISVTLSANTKASYFSLQNMILTDK